MHPKTGMFLRDLDDNSRRVEDMTQTCLDMLGGMQDTYPLSISNRLNEIMKVLAVIATTFIPMTLVAGVDGMQVEYMPGLKWEWGYFGIRGVMLATAEACGAFS